MHMAQLKRRWTRADLARTPDDGNIYEVIRGELFVSPAPRFLHAFIAHFLAGALEQLVAQHRIGYVFHGRPAFVFEDSEVQPDIVVSPYVSAPPPEWEDAPLHLLVVEVLSPTTRRKDLTAKRALYVDAGIEYWIADGDQRAITVIRRDRPDEVVTDRLPWQPPGLTESLELDVALIFRQAFGGVH